MITRKFLPLILAPLVTIVVAGCQSGPAKVCAKIDELSAKASQGSDDALKEMAKGMKQESSTCVTRMKKMELADPETFAKATTCIEDATALDQVVACFFKAALGENKGESKGKSEGDEAGKKKSAEPSPTR